MTLIIKGLGLITVFAVCTAFGFSRAAALKRRAAELEDICCRLRELGQYLRYEGVERMRLVQKTFAGSDAVTVLNGGISIAEGIFAPQDRQLLEEFFQKLGSSDVTAECERVELYVGLLSRQQEIAAKNAAEQGKLYRTMGLCAGAAGCLLLI